LANWQWFGRIHTRIYRATAGRIGRNLVGLDMLLLTTTGRKTGLPRTAPMPYFRDGDAWVIVGSNGGAATNPAWMANLATANQAEIQVGGETWTVTSRVASAEERTRLWPELKKWNKNYQRYEKKTDREIPVVFLETSPPGST
jgi:deazaflavin-dependent oxidoreductase (nitroreductase family)